MSSSTHAARSAINARSLTAVLIAIVVLLLGLGLGATLALADEPAEAEMGTSDGVRFMRADLVDVATFVGEATHTGFVLETPELRTLSLSLFAPDGTTPDRLRAMFDDALAGQQLEAVTRDGYWLIRRARATPEAVSLDFRNTPLSEVTGFLSGVTGTRFVVTSDLPVGHLTVQAHETMTATEALELVIEALEAEGVEVDRSDATTIVLKGRRASRSTPSPADSADAAGGR